MGPLTSAAKCEVALECLIQTAWRSQDPGMIWNYISVLVMVLVHYQMSSQGHVTMQYNGVLSLLSVPAPYNVLFACQWSEEWTLEERLLVACGHVIPPVCAPVHAYTSSTATCVSWFLCQWCPRAPTENACYTNNKCNAGCSHETNGCRARWQLFISAPKLCLVKELMGVHHMIVGKIIMSAEKISSYYDYHFNFLILVFTWHSLRDTLYKLIDDNKLLKWLEVRCLKTIVKIMKLLIINSNNDNIGDDYIIDNPDINIDN